MSTSTATSWSSGPEAETPDSENHHTGLATGLKEPLHQLHKGGARDGAVDDVVGWMRLGDGDGDGGDDEEDRQYTRMADDDEAERPEVLLPERRGQDPLDPDKLSRIAQVFGVAPRIGGARLGVGLGLGATSNGAFPTSRSGSINDGSSSDHHAHAELARFSHSRSSSRSGQLKPLTIVASRSVSARDGLGGLGPGLSSPAYSSFSRSSSTSAVSYAPGSASFTDLITVVPPDHLFLPSSYASGTTGDGDDSAKELRRWRKGRLLPFRMSLRDMLGAISREWGLPSTVGLEVYLVHVRATDIASGSDVEDGTESAEVEEGGLIGAEVWPMLWTGVKARTMRSSSDGLAGRKMSNPSPLGPGRLNERTLTPSAAENVKPFIPMANPGYLTPTTSGFNFPTTGDSPSARSAVSSPGKGSGADHRTAGRRAHQQLGYGLPSGRPHTPDSSSATVILGKVEFDLDRSKATWYDLWNQRRKESAKRSREAVEGSSDGGFRQLTLSTRQDPAPAPLQPLQLGPKVAVAEEVDPLADTFPSMEDELDTLRREREPRSKQLDISAIGTDAILRPDLDLADIGSTLSDVPQDDVAEVRQMLAAAGNPMLASPIDISSPVLGKDAVAETGKFTRQHTLGVPAPGAVDNRGSAVIMSETLDKLAEALNIYRPRSIVAELAQTNEPANPPPLAPPPRTASIAAATSTASKRASPSARAMLDAQKSPKSPEAPPAASWPAVPFAKTPESAAMPLAGRHQYLKVTPRSAIDGSVPTPISPETMNRMQYEHVLPERPKAPASGWKPQRPVRPPTPPAELLVSISRDDRGKPTETADAPKQSVDDVSGHAPTGGPLTSAAGSIKSLKAQMSIPGFNKLFQRKVSPTTTHAAETPFMTMGGDETVSTGPPATFRRSSSRRRSSNKSHTSGSMSITSPLSPKQMAAYEAMHASVADDHIIGRSNSTTRSTETAFSAAGAHGSTATSGQASARTSERSLMTQTSRTVSTGRIPSASHTPVLPQTPADSKSSTANIGNRELSPQSPNSVRRKPVPRVLSGSDVHIQASSSFASDLGSFALERPPVGQRKTRAVT